MRWMMSGALVCAALAAEAQAHPCDAAFPAACVDPSTTVAPGAVIGAGVDVGPGLVIGVASVAPRAVLGGRVDRTGALGVGDGTAIGRRTAIGVDSTLGQDNAIARAVVAGADLTVEDDVTVGYAVQLGDGVTLQTGAALGNLAQVLDGATISGSVGRDATIGPEAQVHGDVGPEAEIGEDAVIVDGAKVRRGATIGARARVESTAVVGRGATVGNGAVIGDGAVVRANGDVPACSDLGVDDVVGRGGSWTGATLPGCVANPVAAMHRLVSRTGATCAAVTGAAKCWGDPVGGRTGAPPPYSPSGATSIPFTQSSLTGVAEVAVGTRSSCARTGGEIRCWGANLNGLLGSTAPTAVGSTSHLPNDPVTGITTAIQVSVGDTHACALLEDGSVRCWGENTLGQLGIGSRDTSAHPTPAAVSGVSGAVQVEVSDHHACALLDTGRVKCWGRDNNGQLGRGIASPDCGSGGDDCSTTPAEVIGLTDADFIAVGHNNACARRATGSWVCWGHNAYGQLGTGASGSSTTYSPVAATALPANTVRVAPSNEHACAITASGAAFCWGIPDHGRLGNGSSTGSTVLAPTAVSLPAPAVEIVTGWRHSCALLDTGAIRCWGYDGEGQIGNDSTLTSAMPNPTPVTGIP